MQRPLSSPGLFLRNRERHTLRRNQPFDFIRIKITIQFALALRIGLTPPGNTALRARHIGLFKEACHFFDAQRMMLGPLQCLTLSVNDRH